MHTHVHGRCILRPITLYLTCVASFLPNLHCIFALLVVPLDIMVASAGASQLAYLFTTSPVGSRGPFQHAVDG